MQQIVNNNKVNLSLSFFFSKIRNKNLGYRLKIQDKMVYHYEIGNNVSLNNNVVPFKLFFSK